MASVPLLLKLVSIGVALYVLKVLFVSKKKSTPLPPGPKPLPIVGNIRDLPPDGVPIWEHWLKHKDLYGPISSVTVFGTTIVILSDAKLAFELMDKRGNKYSSRPDMEFSMQMCGWKDVLSSQHYSARFRAYRKQVHQVMGTTTALSKFYPTQEIEVHRFLLRTLRKPQELIQNIRTEAGAIILKMTYGYTIEPHKADPLVDIADKALQQFSDATAAGVWMVDVLPALKYLPDWVPGTGFKRTAREWKATLTALAEKPMHFVKQQVAEKRNQPSMVSNMYEKAGNTMSAEEEHVAKWTSASLYAGGADTTVSTLSTFFLAMTLHPEIQQKAREEIDRVVGTHRLPSIRDREALPFIEAVVKECFRWQPVGPMGLPHVTSEDDYCEGYLIPEGALVIPNIWWYTHDPNVYAEPMSFNPDRYLTSKPPPDPTNYIFGFGRRICPGRLLAESSVWLTVARSLAALDIRKGIENGKEIEPLVQFSPGIISHPLPFKATITARSPKHEQLIRAVETEHPWEESSAKTLEGIQL